MRTVATLGDGRNYVGDEHRSGGGKDSAKDHKNKTFTLKQGAHKHQRGRAKLHDPTN